MIYWEESFKRVSAYTHKQAVIDAISGYFLDGYDDFFPCPYFQKCHMAKNICRKSVAKGIVLECRAFEELRPLF